MPEMPKPFRILEKRNDHSLFLFSKENKLRKICVCITRQKAFDYIILLFIALNCITLAMERPSIPPLSKVCINLIFIY
jgi:voltage-dependent calcium channel T type alpha-1G